MDGAGRVKRYNLALPAELYEELQNLADKRQTTVVDLLRKSVKLGLLVAKIEETPGSALIIREDGAERQVLVL